MQLPKLSRAMAKVMSAPGVKGVLNATTRARIFDSAMADGRVLSRAEALRMAAQIDPDDTAVKHLAGQHDQSSHGGGVSPLAAEINSHPAYHVTTAANAQSIRSGGFRASTDAYNAFGPGVYLSLDKKDVPATVRASGGKAKKVMTVHTNVQNPYEVREADFDKWEATAVKHAGGKVGRDGTISYGGRSATTSIAHIRLRREIAQQALKDTGYDSIVFRPRGSLREYVTGGQQIVVFDAGTISTGQP